MSKPPTMEITLKSPGLLCMRSFKSMVNIIKVSFKISSTC